jgi:hypothetical protein
MGGCDKESAMLRASVVFGVLVTGALAIGVGLSACSAPEEPAKVTPQSDSQPAQPTVFDATVGTMDRARAVQDTSDQHARDLEQAEQQATGR